MHRKIRLPNTDETSTLDTQVNKQAVSNTFSSTVEDVTVERKVISDFPSPILQAMDPNHVSTVVDYLNKPVPVFSTIWATSAVRGATLNDGLLTGNDTWEYVSSVPMWVDKLKGFLGLRSTLCFRMELNGTPFHAGRLRLCYYPAADTSDNKVVNHTLDFISLSQLPGVDIEASESSVTLRIPYISISRFLELNAPTVRDWGRLFMVVASPLTIGSDGPNSIGVRLWAWMEDIELFGQTLGIVTQGPESQSAPRKRKGRLAPSDSESRPISSFLSSASEAVGALSQIPAVAPYTGPTSWALSALSGVASAFGWSKPSAEASISRVYQNPFGTSANSNGIEPVHNLALDADSKVRAIDDAAPSGMDETSFAYIKTQFSYLNTVLYTDTAPVDNYQFYKLDLAPLLLRGSGGGLTFHSPVSWLASGFSCFRGGFDVKIKMAKTSFHRGKIQVSFVPGINPANVSLLDSAYAYRTVIDLAEGNEFCFRIPYLIPLDYLSVDVSASTFYMHYITPLRSSGNVASTVAMDVYIRGAPDLQFQFPVDPVFVPYQAIPTPVVVTQGPNDLINTGEIDCAPLGGAVDPSLDVSFALESASEMPLSVTQMLKRYVKIDIDPSTAAYAQFDMYPYSLSASFEVDPINTATKTNYQSFWTAPFAFQRGSVRHKFTFSNEANTESSAFRADASYIPEIGPVLGSLSTRFIYSSNDRFAAETSAHQQAGGLIVSCPYASRWRMSPIGYRRLASDVYSFDYCMGRLKVNNLGDLSSISRAYGDDYQLVFFVGIPAMVTAPT